MKLQKTDRLISVLIDLDLWTWRRNIRLAGGFTLHVDSIPDVGHGGGRQTHLGGKKVRRGLPQKRNRKSSGGRGVRSTRALKRARLDRRLAIRTADAARAARTARAENHAPRRRTRVLKVTSTDVTNCRSAPRTEGRSEDPQTYFGQAPRRLGEEALVSGTQLRTASSLAEDVAAGVHLFGGQVKACSHRFCSLWQRTAGPADLCQFCEGRREKGLSCGH
jgi:hypothetical protein